MTTGRQTGSLFSLGRCIRRLYSTTRPARNQKGGWEFARPLPGSSAPKPVVPSIFRGNPALQNAPSKDFQTLFEAAVSQPPLDQMPRKAARQAAPFQPASINEMPLDKIKGAPSIAPPERQMISATEQKAGYIYIHCVAITKNTHVTITNHKHNPIIVMSCGQLGFKHSKRDGPEAAYSVARAAFEKLAESNLSVESIEIVLKGFGRGRYGFLGALEGPHGVFVRRKIVRMTDATPLQIGGVRARNERRR
jgi:ribosomal protein S11